METLDNKISLEQGVLNKDINYLFYNGCCKPEMTDVVVVKDALLPHEITWFQQVLYQYLCLLLSRENKMIWQK